MSSTSVSISRSELVNAVKDSDREKIVSMLKSFGFSKTMPVLFTGPRRELALELLSRASAIAGSSQFDENVVSDLIDYLSMSVELVWLLDIMLSRPNYAQASDYDQIPGGLKKILAKDLLPRSATTDWTTEKVAKIFATLPENVFLSTCRYIIDGNIEGMSIFFNHAFIRYIHEHRLLSSDWLLAYMAICLCEPIAEYGVNIPIDFATFLGRIPDDLMSDLFEIYSENDD